jgi:recombination protein RecT
MSNDLAVQGPKNIVDRVGARIQDMVKTQTIALPEGYNAGNALKEAYLVLQETVDRNKRPALEVCTNESIASALLAMVVSGLSVARNQGYFIVYGKKLTFMRSYMGSQALAKRLNPTLQEINSSVIREGDTFEYEVLNGKPYVTTHKSAFSNSAPIIGAYAVAVDANGETMRTEIMTIDEIHTAWKQSKQRPINDDGTVKPGSVHSKFEHEMCRRTVINRVCKALVNTSPISGVKEIIQQKEISIAQGQLEEEIEDNANKIEFQPEEFPDVEIPSDAEIAGATEEVEENPFDEE